jgi:hypothetical protein
MEIMPARVPRDMAEDVVGRNGTRGRHASLAEPRGQLPHCSAFWTTCQRRKVAAMKKHENMGTAVSFKWACNPHDLAISVHVSSSTC